MVKLDDMMLNKEHSFSELKVRFSSVIRTLDSAKEKKKLIEEEAARVKIEDRGEKHLFKLLDEYRRYQKDGDFNKLIELRKYNQLLDEYISLEDTITSLERFNWINKLVHDGLGVNFNAFGSNQECPHQFILDDGKIICAICQESTHELDELSSTILKVFAKKQNRFIEGATSYDIPFIKNITQEYFSDNLIDIDDEQLNVYLNTIIKRAHDNSERVHAGIISETELRKRLIDIDTTLIELEDSNSRFKDLFVELCDVATYEALLLSGTMSISEIVNSAICSFSEYLAFIKAYYNLTSDQFKNNCEYFTNLEEASNFDCMTNDEHINNQINLMRYRR